MYQEKLFTIASRKSTAKDCVQTMRDKFFHRSTMLFAISFFYYVLLFFLPYKTIVHLAILSVIGICMYLIQRNVRTVLVFLIILTLPHEYSLFGGITQMTVMEPKVLGLGLGIPITTTTLLVGALLFTHLMKRSFAKSETIEPKTPDIFLFLFFCWSFITFILLPHINALYGLFNLSELLLLYFLLRIDLKKNMISDVISIISASLLFQVGIGLIQAAFTKNIGVPTELVTSSFPYGATASENTDIFRITGLFGHPNFFAGYLIAFFPFLFVRFRLSFLRIIAVLLSIAAIIFTQGRAVWTALGGFLAVLCIKRRNDIISVISSIEKKFTVLIIGLIIIVSLFLSPHIILRLRTVPEVFDKGGSISTRVLLTQEAFNIISQYPFTGVGLNRALEYYSQHPFTTLFDKVKPTTFYKIHNIFLEVASEVGLPGMFFFLSFILSVVSFSVQSEATKNSLIFPYKKAALHGLLLWLFIAFLNPFFHTSQMRFLMFLSAFLLV